MFDQPSFFNLVTLAIALVSIILAIVTFAWQVYRSRKDDQHQDKQSLTQDRQAEALESQTEALLRQANIWEQSLLKDPPRPEGETAEQRWTRALVLGQIASATISLTEEFQRNLAPVTTTLADLKARVADIVTLRDYMDHQANMYKTVAEGEQIRNQIHEEIREYQRQGLDPDEIQRQILTAIGNGLLRMAAPLPPVPPALAENEQEGQFQADG